MNEMYFKMEEFQGSLFLVPEWCVAVVEDVDGAEVEAGDALPVAEVAAVPAQHHHEEGREIPLFGENYLDFSPILHQVRVFKMIHIDPYSNDISICLLYFIRCFLKSINIHYH